MTIAKDFYGEATYAKCNRSSKRGEGKLLDDAVHWLDKAIEFEAKGDVTKTNMAFGAALKAEGEALA